MKRQKDYHTKQREAVYNYLMACGGAHVTAAQMIEYFVTAEFPIGRTTVYRCLDKLLESGKIRKYITDGVSGACYQYVDEGSVSRACHNHLHLKCEECGELLHLECDVLEHLQQHVLDSHAFRVNVMKTVLYGKCDNCLKKDDFADGSRLRES